MVKGRIYTLGKISGLGYGESFAIGYGEKYRRRAVGGRCWMEDESLFVEI